MINKKKILKNTGIGLLFIFLVIQFFHPKKNLSNNDTNYIANNFPVPDSIQQIIKQSCFDCHSNYTDYPWYSRVQPVHWWLQNHINDGKRSLNFSEFSSYRIYRQYSKFQGIIDELKDDEMPLPSYLLIHRSSILNAAQKEQLISWAQSQEAAMEKNFPPDSLVNPNKKKK